MTTRKYEGDGHMEHIDPARLIIGCVLRMPYRSGSVPTFGDSVITGIYTKSYKSDRPHWYPTLAEALAGKTQDDYVYVKLSRPYLYAHNIGGAMPNWLVGVETYEAMGHTLSDTHKVVVNSTGEYSNYTG